MPCCIVMYIIFMAKLHLVDLTESTLLSLSIFANLTNEIYCYHFYVQNNTLKIFFLKI